MEAGETVFAIDDEPEVLAALARSLTKRGYTVEGYSSGEAFLAAYGEGRPGCIILDYGLPVMSGLDVQAALIARGIPAQIIFVTGHGGIPESVRATKAGAIDFLEKPYRPQILVDRIEEALRLDREERQRKKRAAARENALSALTDREREVFDLMMVRPELSSSKGIAIELDISPRTVDKHRAQILQKTNCRTLPELVRKFARFANR